MPRRPPPTPLRLAQGPLPSRSHPKHTLPSVPRPVFHPDPVVEGPPARSRANSLNEHSSWTEPLRRLSIGQLPPLVIPRNQSLSRRSSWDEPSSPASIHSNSSGESSPRERTLRGPWNHSGSIRVPFDVSNILAPPQPAAFALPIPQY